MIGELIAATCDDPEILARLGGPIGEAARDASLELAELPPVEARAWRVRLIAALRSPIPPGIRGVHASWIEASLAGLPARVRDALAAGAPDRVDVWLVRWACAELPPLKPIDPAIQLPGKIEHAVKMSGDALTRWLAEVGADQLAYALRSNPDALQGIASTLANGDRVIAASRRIGSPPRAGALGGTRDAIARCRCEASPEMLMWIGARALAPHTDPLLRRQLAVRLPRPRGLRLLAELAARADDPIDRAPTWDALAAPSSR